MSHLKKEFILLLAVVFCLSLTVCTGDYLIVGDDWCTTGIVFGGGTITRNGEDTDVLVCVRKTDAAFYYDLKDQTLFGFTDYPTAFGSNVRDPFKGIDFADLNDDSNSDVAMKPDDNGSELGLVWYRDAESLKLVYQPEKPFIGDRETMDEIYHELLDRFYVLVSDPDSNTDTMKDGEFGIREPARGMGRDALNGMGYLIEDLSGDGVSELAMGSLREYGGEINAPYTLADNEPELVLGGWGRNSYAYANTYVGDSSCFYNCGSDSAVESGHGIFTLSRNERELEWRRFYFTHAEVGNLDNVAIYVDITGNWEPEGSEPADTTLEEYYEWFSTPVVENMMDFWGMSYTESGLYLTPFSDYTVSVGRATTGTERDDCETVPVLMGGALPPTNMEPLQSENYEDGTYYYADIMEDGVLRVVDTVLPSNFMYDVQTPEDHLTACAMNLGESGTAGYLPTVEQNDTYTKNTSYPVYTAIYIVGEDEDTREWTVLAMNTDHYTYPYAFDAMADVAENMKPTYHDISADLYLSDGEYEDD